MYSPKVFGRSIGAVMAATLALAATYGCGAGGVSSPVPPGPGAGRAASVALRIEDGASRAGGNGIALSGIKPTRAGNPVVKVHIDGIQMTSSGNTTQYQQDAELPVRNGSAEGSVPAEVGDARIQVKIEGGYLERTTSTGETVRVTDLEGGARLHEGENLVTVGWSDLSPARRMAVLFYYVVMNPGEAARLRDALIKAIEDIVASTNSPQEALDAFVRRLQSTSVPDETHPSDTWRGQSYARIVGGNLNGQQLTGALNQVHPDAQGNVRGTVELEVKNSGESGWVFPLLWCSTAAVDHRQFTDIVRHQAPGVARYTVNIDVKATSGWLIFCGGWEMRTSNIASLTNWAVAGGDRFNDGNDIQDLSDSVLAGAAQSGRARVGVQHDNTVERMLIPLVAIKLVH